MIEIKGVTKRFGDNLVLDDISFSVREGGTLALFGPSGTGKSVLLKHIIGLIEPGRLFGPGPAGRSRNKAAANPPSRSMRTIPALFVPATAIRFSSAIRHISR